MNNGFVHFAEFEPQIIAQHGWLFSMSLKLRNYHVYRCRLQSFCCGGGAGLVAVAEWSEARIKAGKPKADQIRQTGAKIVVTSCDNCRHQITELSEHYNLGIKVTSLTELTVQALVIK
jgi:Fe-S oxidoreductase